MSTAAQNFPAWKQEVNRRLAEHRGRTGATAVEPDAPLESQSSASRRAQQAAARVAARYANAPSYSEVLAAEARAALRAAEAASRAALEAQIAAEQVLAGIEVAQAAEPKVTPFAAAAIEPTAAPPRGPELVDDELREFEEREPGPALVRMESPAVELIDIQEPVLTVEPVEPVSIRWDRELPARPIAPMPMYTGRGNGLGNVLFETEWWRPAASSRESAHEPVEIEMVEPAQPIPANLIEFPRELVAPRKARPRLAETLHGAGEAGVQLSIFEVDPGKIYPGEIYPGEILPGRISIEPAASAPAEAQDWTAPSWSGIELDALPREDAYDPAGEPAPQAQAAPALESMVDPAPVSLRLMAAVVDGALIAGSLIGAALTAATHMSAMPAPRTVEIGVGAGLLAVAAFYYVLFFTLARSTPGVLYAQVRLSAFDGGVPTRAQRWVRLAAMLLSVLPVGLGVAWAIFDDDHLCWHDRLSRTYLCRR